MLVIFLMLFLLLHAVERKWEKFGMELYAKYPSLSLISTSTVRILQERTYGETSELWDRIFELLQR